MAKETPLPVVGLIITLCVLAGVLGLTGWWWTTARSTPEPAAAVPEHTDKKPRVHREAALLFVTYPPKEAASVRSPHNYKGRPLCQRCHVQNTASLADSPVSLCRQCHTEAHDHPVEVHQKTPMTKALRLGPGGALLCHTCHDHHDVYQHEHGLLLEGDALCAACHVAHANSEHTGH